jgi:ribosomal protein L18
MDMDLDIAKSAQSSGDNVYAQVMANRRQASQVLASTSNADLQSSIEQAKLSYNANKDNVRNILDAAKIEGTNALQRAVEASDSSQRGLALLTDLQNKKNEIFITESKDDKTLLAADAYLRQNPDDPAARTAYDAAYKALQIRVNSYFEMKSDKGLSFNEVEELALKLAQGESISLGNVPTSATSTGFSADDFGPMTVK